MKKRIIFRERQINWFNLEEVKSVCVSINQNKFIHESYVVFRKPEEKCYRIGPIRTVNSDWSVFEISPELVFNIE